MPPSPEPVSLSKAATNEIVFVASHADKLDRIFGTTAEGSAGVTFRSAAAEVGLSEADIRRIVDVVNNLQNVQARLNLDVDGLLVAISQNIERHFGEPSPKSDALRKWAEAKGKLAELLRQLDRKNPLILTAKAEQLGRVW